LTDVTLLLRHPISGLARAPPSKSYTHRALLIASLAEGRSVISNALSSRDTDATASACAAFGARLEKREGSLLVEGCVPSAPSDVIDAMNSGTTLRFMTSALSLAREGYSVITGDESIRRRPMQPLLDALGSLGVYAWSTRGNGCAPIVVRGGGMKGGEARMRGDISSQFVSSILIASPLAEGDDVLLRVDGAVSRPYIDATLSVMKHYGVEVSRDGYELFTVCSGQRYSGSDFTVPGDFSSASFLLAAAAVTGGRVEVKGLGGPLPQGDERVLQILKKMGVSVSRGDDSVTVRSDGSRLSGGVFNLSDTPDLLPVVAVLALRCDSPVTVTGVAHARHKETDRISVLAGELVKLGVSVREERDGLTVSPAARLRRAGLDSHGDHRMFMAFCLASLLLPRGLPVSGRECLDVSYPGFLDDISRLGATVMEGER
jgi:3-phosphoshikimate 1-carboxyvinyltransferase